MTAEMPNAEQRGYDRRKDPFLWLGGLFAIALTVFFLQGIWGDINWQAVETFTMFTFAATQASAARNNWGVQGRETRARLSIFLAVLCLCAGMLSLLLLF